SAEKVQLLSNLGVDTVVNRSQVRNWAEAVKEATGGRGADIVVETGGLDSLRLWLRGCAPGGSVAAVAALGSGTVDAAALRGLLTLRRLFVGSRAQFEAMNRAIELHQLRPVIGARSTF